MIRSLLAAVSLGCLAACAAPSARDDVLTRWYAKPPDMVSRVAAQVLLDLHFTIVRDEHEAGAAEIEAREPGPGKRQLVLRFLAVNEGTRASVDPGCLDRARGELLLDQITARVGWESARRPPYVRASSEEAIDGTLEEALQALDAAMEHLDAGLMERVVQTGSARVEAEAADKTVFEVSMFVWESGKLGILFTANAGDKETAARQLARMKSEFSRSLSALR